MISYAMGASSSSGGSSSNKSFLELRDAVGYTGRAHVSDNTYVTIYKALPENTGSDNNHFGFFAILVFADNISIGSPLTTPNYYYDIYSLNSEKYSNIRGVIEDDESSSTVIDNALMQEYLTQLRALDPSASFSGALEFQTGGFGGEIEFTDYAFYISFDLSGRNVSTEVYDQIRPLLAQVFEQFENINVFEFTKESEDLVVDLTPKI